MSMNQQNISPEWGQEISAQVGLQVRKYRSELDLSAQNLANRTAQLGYEVKRSVIAEMENGKRNTVSVADVFVLARALAVPPIALLLPIETAETVALLPNKRTDAWTAFDWITGKSDGLNVPEYLIEIDQERNVGLFVETYEAERAHWLKVSEPLRLQFRLEFLTNDYKDHFAQAMVFGVQAKNATETALTDSYKRKMDDSLEQSQEVMQKMARIIGKLRKLGISVKNEYLKQIDEIYPADSLVKLSNQDLSDGEN